MRSPRKFRTSRHLLQSLAVHLSVLAVALIAFRERSLMRTRQPTLPLQLEVSAPGDDQHQDKALPRGDLGDHPSPSVGQSKPFSEGQEGPPSAAKPSLKDLAPGFALLPDQVQATPDSRGNGRENGGSGSDQPIQDRGRNAGFAFAEGLSAAEESELYPFVRALWKRINGATIYPDDFARQRITGTVTVQLEVDSQGRFTGRFFNVSSTEPMLKAYVLVLLAHALREPLPLDLWTGQKSVALVTRFDFDVIGPGELPDTKAGTHFKNVLEFERRVMVEGKVNEAIDHFISRYIPPVIVLPGFFYIDFVQAYRMFQAYSNPDPDEQLQARMDLTREKLDRLVKKQGQPDRR